MNYKYEEMALPHTALKVTNSKCVRGLLLKTIDSSSSHLLQCDIYEKHFQKAS